MKSKTAVLAIVVLVLLLLPALFFLYWPTCLGTPHYDLTVTAITFPAPGKFRIEYEDRLPYGWGVTWGYAYVNERWESRVTNGDAWSLRENRFLRWPVTIREQVSKGEASMEEGPPFTPADEATLRRRILLRAGSTYRIHPGEKLVYYRGGPRDGNVLEGVIEMTPDDPKDELLEYKPELPPGR